MKEISVDEAVSALSDEALVCRDLNHAWAPHTARRIKGGGFERTLQCRVCTTKRSEDLNGFGGVIEGSRRYEYPEGYRVEGVGRFSGGYKDRARLMNMVKRIEQQEAYEAADKKKRLDEKKAPAKQPAKKSTAKKTTAAKPRSAKKTAA